MKMEIERFPRYEEFNTRCLVISFEGNCVVCITSDVNENKENFLFVVMASANQPESNDEEVKKIIEHYSDILGFISTMEDEEIDVLMKECEIKKLSYLKCNDKRSKANCILINTVCRGKEEIRRFLEKIQMLLSNNQQLLDEFKNCMQSLGKTVPLDFIQKYNSVTRESILRLQDCLVEELEIVKVLIPLLQLGVISIDEYRQVNNMMSAVDQRRQLISFVLNSRDGSKIHRFLYVLHDIGRDDILKALLTHQNSIRTDELEDFGFELSDTVTIWELPQYPNMVVDEQVIRDIASSELEVRLIDKWKGSVVLRLQSVLKPEIIYSNREKMANFLKKMYENVKMQPGETKNIDLKIRVIPKDKCIERRKPLGRDLYSKNKFHKTEEDICMTCLQEIVRTNVKVLVAEIESDVISETFNQVGDTSVFVQNMCLGTTASRQRRALLFLKYTLHEKSYLREFYNIFKRKRSTYLVPVKCSTCSKSTSGSDGTLDIQESKLTFILYREDGKNMIISFEDFSRPTTGPSIITTTDDEKHKTEITRRNLENFQTDVITDFGSAFGGKVITALDKETSPPATSRGLMMREPFPYHRQYSMPDLRGKSVTEYLKQITASNSYLTERVSYLSTEVDKLKEIVKDRSQQQV